MTSSAVVYAQRNMQLLRDPNSKEFDRILRRAAARERQGLAAAE